MIKSDESLKILLFEDNQGDAGLIEEMLDEFNNFNDLKIVETLEDGLNILNKEIFDVILLDLGLPDSDGIETLKDVLKITPSTPIIILTGLNNEQIGIQSVKIGAQDYLIKNEIESKLLKRSINYSIERKKIEGELQRSQENLEEKVKERTKELEQSNRELQQFAYVASHDLREPLRMISTFLQLLEKRYSERLDTDAKEFIDFAVDGAKRLDAMIKDLLEYSRVANKIIKFNDVDMNEVLKQTSINLKISIDDNNAKIYSDLLPTVSGDEKLLVQLFQNLISNSIKYRRSENPEIQISVNKELDQYLFSVKDNGIGISQNHLDRIFTIFQRLHTNDEYEGTGIGLAIAQRIVYQHNGNIWADSKIKDGTTIYFTLPINF